MGTIAAARVGTRIQWFGQPGPRGTARGDGTTVALPTWPPSRRNRKSWTWHPDADHECRRLRKQDPWAFGQLGHELVRLTTQTDGRPGRAAKGRIRQSFAPTGSTYLAVLFVERRDRPGLGGLLLHRTGSVGGTRRTGGDPNNPPEGAYETARHRLSQMTGW
jgi:hypothetical protein